MNKDILLLSSFQSKIREYCNGKFYPIELVTGNSPPTLYGVSFFYETSGGRMIYHPSAYSKKGWSNMVYVPSTRHIQVGEDWNILKEFPKLKNSVDYLCYMLYSSGYEVEYRDKMYDIYYGNSNDTKYKDLTLSQFRVIAKRIINLIIFS